MKKGEGSFHSVKIWIVISLTILICSCNGQENSNNITREIFHAQTVSQNSTLDNQPSKEQISQVVRMMFQDSKGNIWFGTQNGAFRLSNDSLIHIYY